MAIVIHCALEMQKEKSCGIEISKFDQYNVHFGPLINTNKLQYRKKNKKKTGRLRKTKSTGHLAFLGM